MRVRRADLITPANGITTAGLFICLIGSLFLNRPLGLTLVLIGRAFDLIDGPVARATRSSQFSKFLDPTADKIALLGILAGAWYYELLPEAALWYVLAQNGLVSVISVAAQRNGTAIGALIAGKINLFLQMCALALFIGSVVLAGGTSLWAYGWAVLGLSVPFGILATYRYAKQLA